MSLNMDTFGTSHFIINFVERLSSFRGDFYRVCINEYFRLFLCWELCPLSECPLSEVSLYSSQWGQGSEWSSSDLATC